MKRETITTLREGQGQGKACYLILFLGIRESRWEADVGSQMSTALLLARSLVISHCMAVLICNKTDPLPPGPQLHICICTISAAFSTAHCVRH